MAMQNQVNLTHQPAQRKARAHALLQHVKQLMCGMNSRSLHWILSSEAHPHLHVTALKGLSII
jgi:hypothetical protein